ncbi:uncharacterized protein LOC135477057 [Liolophura sinensis]|uniref:uncharacterized protein LOC135477057 n=1 Tax=Liolophura sinensis TaxID=3198878 RepID=UPI003158690F
MVCKDVHGRQYFYLLYLVLVSGGDRRTLTPSGCVLENNRIWDFSRAAAVGSHGIALGGVGTHVQYNEVTGGRYTGVWWGGNDHVIRRNHLHHLCTGSSDCGGIHADRDWTFRGNVIQQNHIHHVLRFYPGAQVRGVMLDDQYSSVLIEGNVFHDNEIHFNIGGGRDNIARYNVFYNAHSASVGMDGRGINGGSNDKQLHDRLKTVPYTTGIWAQKYPELARIDHEAPGEPRGNQIYKNVLYHGLASHNFNYHGSSLQKSEFFNIHDNFVDTHTSDFNDRGTGDYRVICKAGTWAVQQHFPQPPTEAEVGPHLPYGPKFKHGTVHTKSNGALKHC